MDIVLCTRNKKIILVPKRLKSKILVPVCKVRYDFTYKFCKDFGPMTKKYIELTSTLETGTAKKMFIIHLPTFDHEN